MVKDIDWQSYYSAIRQSKTAQTEEQRTYWTAKAAEIFDRNFKLANTQNQLASTRRDMRAIIEK